MVVPGAQVLSHPGLMIPAVVTIMTPVHRWTGVSAFPFVTKCSLRTSRKWKLRYLQCFRKLDD